MAAPNPYRDPKPFQQVRLGGRLLKAILREVNGNKVEDDWQVTKGTGSSGSTNVFKGTKTVEALELTLEAPDEERFDDLRDIWKLMEPVPGLGGGTGTTSSSGDSSKMVGGVPSATNSDASSSSTSTSSTVPTSGTSSGASTTGSKSTTSNPGPKPPTLVIENEIVNFIGVTSVSRKAWEGPTWREEQNSWRVKVTFIQDKPSAPAGVGPQAPPKPGSQFSGGAADSPQASADATKAAATGKAGGV